jgi:hypothetical protein
MLGHEAFDDFLAITCLLILARAILRSLLNVATDSAAFTGFATRRIRNVEVALMGAQGIDYGSSIFFL